MKEFTAFVQFVLETLAATRKVVFEKKEAAAFVILVSFFRGLTAKTKTSMKEFSDNVLMLVRNMFSRLAEHEMLATTMMEFPNLVYPQMLTEYLLATRDEVVARFFISQLFENEPEFSREILFNDKIVWEVKRAYAVLKAMAPEQLTEFGTVVLEAWPKLPEGVRGLLLAQEREVKSETAQQSKPVSAPPIKTVTVPVKKVATPASAPKPISKGTPPRKPLPVTPATHKPFATALAGMVVDKSVN